LYELPQKGFVNLTVYDILGRQVAELVNTEQTAGRYEVEFGSNIIASGIYFYVLKTRDYLSIKKMTLIK
jgi:hypothetical protein